MTINVENLIRSLGKTYQEILDAGFIPYKTKPTGFSGDEVVFLDMITEGVFLAFKRENKILNEITLRIQYDKKKNWAFPNELPAPLQQVMPRQWVHEQFGEPEKALPPRKRLKKEIGWTERYIVEGFHIPITMKVDYELDEIVKKITFLPTSDVNW